MKNLDLKKSGYTLGVISVIIVLFWIGLLKFTPPEAMAIKGYVSHSFLMNWLYSITSVQGVSNIIGIYEIVTAILLVGSFWSSKVGEIAGYLTVIIFLTTLSFLITTPGVWKFSDGIIVTDFFVIKDIAFLAIALQVIGNSKNTKKSTEQ